MQGIAPAFCTLRGVISVKEEESGGSCDYYRVDVSFTFDGRDGYTAECGEIIEALQLNQYEANAFKEIWRMAAARQGKQKKGNTEVRGGEKIEWCGQMIKKRAEYYGS